MRVDRAVGAEVIERLQPLGVEAALAALEARGHEDADKRRQIELALEQARFEVSTRDGSTTQSILTTASSPASSSDAGMNA